MNEYETSNVFVTLLSWGDTRRSPPKDEHVH